MTFNARSLRNKTFGVIEFLKEHNCDVCFVTEAWLKVKDTAVVSEITDMGYEIILQPRKGSRRGGGVSAVHKKSIDIKKCKVCSYKSFELLEVTIKSKTELLRVATIYRTGTLSTRGRSTFTDEFDDYLQLLSQKKGEKFLCGDFNIHVEEDYCLDKIALYCTTDSYDFHQVVNQSTHRDGGTLDLVFAQRGSKYFTSVTNSLFVYDLCHSLTSDHKFIEFRIPFTRKNNPTKYIKLSYRNFKNVNSYAFSADVISFLNEKSNDFFLENAESATNLFHNSLNHVIEQYAPLIETSVKQKKTEFTNSDITSLRRQRRKAERDYRKNKNESDRILYQSFVKEVKTFVRGTRIDYYHKELSSSLTSFGFIWSQKSVILRSYGVI